METWVISSGDVLILISYSGESSELKNITEKNGFSNTNLVGIKFSPITQQWKQSADVSVNYISTYTKN